MLRVADRIEEEDVHVSRRDEVGQTAVAFGTAVNGYLKDLIAHLIPRPGRTAPGRCPAGGTHCDRDCTDPHGLRRLALHHRRSAHFCPVGPPMRSPSRQRPAAAVRLGNRASGRVDLTSLWSRRADGRSRQPPASRPRVVVAHEVARAVLRAAFDGGDFPVARRSPFIRGSGRRAPPIARRCR